MEKEVYIVFRNDGRVTWPFGKYFLIESLMVLKKIRKYYKFRLTFNKQKHANVFT